MGEMKTWVTPEVEVQTFQANEYVSVCYAGSNANLDFGDNLLTNAEFLYYESDEGRKQFSLNDIVTDPIANTANSGKVYTLYVPLIGSVGQIFVDKNDKIHLLSTYFDNDYGVERDNTQWS